MAGKSRTKTEKTAAEQTAEQAAAPAAETADMAEDMAADMAAAEEKPAAEADAAEKKPSAEAETPQSAVSEKTAEAPEAEGKEEAPPDSVVAVSIRIPRAGEEPSGAPKRRKKIKTIGVLTSGGDSPGMNAAIRAVVRRSYANGIKVKGIYKGYDGLVYDDIKTLTPQDVSEIIERGGTILYTARCPDMLTDRGVLRAAETIRKHKIDGLVVIGGDGSFRGAGRLAEEGVNVVGIPGTIDLDIACTDYTIGFDTAVNTAMEAIDKVRDTSASHERVSVIEVMGRNAGYLALWCGIANGAEDIILPEKYDGDLNKIIENIIDTRRRGKKHHIIVNAEGIGHSYRMAKEIEAATGIETRATILGYMQRGGSPTARDRVLATTMGSLAVDLLIAGKNKRVVGYRDGKFMDFDIAEALKMEKRISEYQWEMARSLSNSYRKTL